MLKSGIYALYWDCTGMVYVGQSQDMSSRFKEHARKLRKGTHTNFKVQNEYNVHGLPEFIVLEHAEIHNLNDLEIVWTSEFNSIKCGLNLIEAGSVGYGTESNNSKYTKIQILLAFRAVSSNMYYTREQLEEKSLGVLNSTCRDIYLGRSHKWLSIKYPFRYSLMQDRRSKWVLQGQSLQAQISRKGSARDSSILDPSGNIHYISNIREFAKEHKLNNAHLGSVLRGTRHNHQGWSLPKDKYV
jgi:group I intron endonuclease